MKNETKMRCELKQILLSNAKNPNKTDRQAVLFEQLFAKIRI